MIQERDGSGMNGNVHHSVAKGVCVARKHAEQRNLLFDILEQYEGIA